MLKRLLLIIALLLAPTLASAQLQDSSGRGITSTDIVGGKRAIDVNLAGGSVSISGADGALQDGADSNIKATVSDYANSNPLNVRLTDTNGDYVAAGAGTQYTEDAASAADPIGSMLICRRRDALSSETSTDGDNTAVNCTAKSEVYVKHVDSVAVTGPLTDSQLRATPVPMSGTVTANAGSGTFTNQQSNKTADFDTGAGTDTVTMFGFALPANGGAVPGGTATNPVRTDPTGSTTQPVSGTVTATQSTIGNLKATVTGNGAVLGESIAVRCINSANNAFESCAGAGGSGGTSSAFGAAVPSDGTAAGFSDGTNMQPARVFDTDSGAGTQLTLGVSLRKAASGGSVEAGTSSDPLRVDPTGSTTQPVSGTVTANAGTNLNTSALSLEATQVDIRTSVQLIDDAVATTGSATPAKGILAAGTDGTNARGIKTDANGELQVDVLTLPANASVNVAQINGVTPLMGSGNTGTGSPRVTIATDQPTLSNTFGNVGEVPITSGGLSSCVVQSAASTNATNCKASAGQLYNIEVINTTSTIYYLRLYNSSGSPTCSSSTGFVRTVPIPHGAGAGAGVGFNQSPGEAFGTGIGFCLTGGGSSTDNTNAATGVYITLLYK